MSLRVQSGASTLKSLLKLVGMGDAQRNWLKLAMLTRPLYAKLLA